MVWGQHISVAGHCAPGPLRCSSFCLHIWLTFSHLHPCLGEWLLPVALNDSKIWVFCTCLYPATSTWGSPFYSLLDKRYVHFLQLKIFQLRSITILFPSMQHILKEIVALWKIHSWSHMCWWHKSEFGCTPSGFWMVLANTVKHQISHFLKCPNAMKYFILVILANEWRHKTDMAGYKILLL